MIFQSNKDIDPEKLKYEILFSENTYIQIRLNYVNDILDEAILVNKDEKETKIRLRKSEKSEKNKKNNTIIFNFLSKPKLLLPIIQNNQVIAFFCKYSTNNEDSKTEFFCKEKKTDIIIPDNHVEILKSIQNLNLRIDMTYFLKGI